LREQIGSQYNLQRYLKMQYKLALILHPSKCTIISVFRQSSCGLSNCLCCQQGETSRKNMV